LNFGLKAVGAAFYALVANKVLVFALIQCVNVICLSRIKK